MGKRAYCLALAVILLTASGAHADNGGGPSPAQIERRASMIPEPTNLFLFAAGVAGLIIGRRSSRSRRKDD